MLATVRRIGGNKGTSWLGLSLLVANFFAGCRAQESKATRMSPSADHTNEAIVRFHQIVSNGTLEELQTALKNGIDVNAPGRVGRTALMLAIEAKNLEKVKLLIQHGADPELTDDMNHTPLQHAVGFDFSEGVQCLLELGVDRGYHPKYPLKTIDYDSLVPQEELLDEKMPEDLKSIMSKEEWEKSLVEMRESMREIGQNPTIEPTISEAQSVEVLKLFLETGDDLNLASTEMKRALIGLETGGELRVSESDYETQKSRRFGSRNPERMDLPFWKDMIRTGGSAYSARARFEGEDAFNSSEAVWCYDRFGTSLTQLRDGRFVQIGGEHEDFYDPDFMIYNDVVVHDGQGHFEIYGYPRDEFPPTDFHTATLCPDGIYIIGCLGYKPQRQQGFTPVYKLTLESWQIELVKTTGEMPGWIHDHRATYEPERNAILISGGKIEVIGEDGNSKLVPNEHSFELDLVRRNWRRSN